MKLYYGEQNAKNIPRYNGNISFIKWQSVCPDGISNPELLGQKGYSYYYDKLNRLTNAVFHTGTQMAVSWCQF